MQFSSKEDIEAPIAEVFALLSEFESFERSAIRRGIEVQRIDAGAAPSEGAAWDTRFDLRGKRREMRVELVRYDPPNAMHYAAVSQGVEAMMTLDLLALSQRRTRVAIVLNLKPKTLAARLMIQSLRLGKATLTKRFKLRIAEFAKSMEERHQKTA